MFKTAYSEKERVNTSSGNRIQNEYQYEKNKKGEKILVKSGETDLYAKIQESHEETKIENVLKRVVAGDNTVLRPDGIYMDTTEIPNNMIQAQQTMQTLENTWRTLPNEIKEKYNFDVGQFIAASGSKEWLINMGLLKEDAKKIAEEVKEIKQAATVPTQSNNGEGETKA